MSRFPSLPLFTDAFIADTGHLTAAETGAYLMLLMVAWRTPECCLPDDDAKLARWARMDLRTWKRAKAAIMEFWNCENGQWTQKRLLKERDVVSKRAEVARENGKQGGRPNSLKDNDTGNPAGSPRVSQKKAPNPNPNPITAADATRASLDFADEVMKAAGIDLEFVPPAWCGLAMRLEAVIAQGWKPDLILETVRATSGRKRDGPARSFAYFEPAIAEAHARQQAPVPTATIVPLKAEKTHVEQPRANKWAQARSSILARFGTGEGADDGDERECGIRAGSGDGDVKLLPQG